MGNSWKDERVRVLRIGVGNVVVSIRERISISRNVGNLFGCSLFEGHRVDRKW